MNAREIDSIGNGDDASATREGTSYAQAGVDIEAGDRAVAVSYTHLTLPTTPYV